MEENRRVYPSYHAGSKWVSALLLMVTVLLLIGGLLQKKSDLSIVPIPAQTPIPLNEAFDESMVTQEITLPESTWYALQLGAFEEEQRAKEMAELFTKRGAAGFVWNDGRFRAIAAVYSSKEDAQNVREKLSNVHSVESHLYPIQLHPLVLRITGMKGQLEILQAAFLHANDLCHSIQRTSMEMDQQIINAAEAIQALRALDDQTQVVQLRLEQRFSQPRHAVVSGLIACFDDFHSFCDERTGEESLVELSVKVKYQSLQSLYLLQNVYSIL